MTKVLSRIRTFFNFESRNATFKKEVLGGVSTFLAMAYILAVNPSILSLAGGKGPNGYEGVFFLATAISSFFGTMFMGLFAKVPIALAPGMGVNAFFAFTVASGVLGLSLEQALVATFVSGLLYMVIVLTPLRLQIARIFPRNIKLAIGAMIGLFLAYIGLVDSGIIVSGAIQPVPDNLAIVSVSTATKLGNIADPFVIISLVTLILVFTLHFLKIRGAAIIAMAFSILMLLIAYLSGVSGTDNVFQLKEYNDFVQFGNLSKGMWEAFGGAFTKAGFYIAVFVFVYVDFFDTTGTLFSVGEQAGLNKKDKDNKWLQKANVVDAGSTIFGSLMLTSTTTSYIESSVGVSQGAKTGFSSVIVSLMFILSIALWPLMNPILPIKHAQEGVLAQGGTIMPVTGPILVLVGSLMISQLKHFEWSKTIDIPVLFIILIFGAFTYSISNGIAAGIVLYFILNASAWGMEEAEKKFKWKSRNINDTIVDTGDVTKVEEKKIDYRKRVLNAIIIPLFIVSIVYFATMPLYFG